MKKLSILIIAGLSLVLGISIGRYETIKSYSQSVNRSEAAIDSSMLEMACQGWQDYQAGKMGWVAENLQRNIGLYADYLEWHLKTDAQLAQNRKFYEILERARNLQSTRYAAPGSPESTNGPAFFDTNLVHEAHPH